MYYTNEKQCIKETKALQYITKAKYLILRMKRKYIVKEVKNIIDGIEQYTGLGYEVRGWINEIGAFKHN